MDRMSRIKTLICLPVLLLFMGCSEVVPLVHDSLRGSKSYPNLGTVKVNIFDGPMLEGEKNRSLKFTPPIDSFLLSTIKTKIIQSNLFTLSDTAVYELSGEINSFRVASTLSAGRLVFGCLGLVSYFGGAVLAIAKNDATYFYVGIAATIPLIGVSQVFDAYYAGSVGFEYAIKKNGFEMYRDTVYAESAFLNQECSRRELLDDLLDTCINRMLKRIDENVK